MKRILSTFIVVIAFALLASGAQATPTVTWLDIAPGTTFSQGPALATYGQPYIIGYEYLQSLPANTPIQIDLGSSALMESPGDCSTSATTGAFGNILYSPMISISVGSTVVMTANNGALKNAQYALWNLGNPSGSPESQALFALGGTLCANMNASSASGITGGLSSITLQFTNAYNVISTAPVGTPAVEAGDIVVLLNNTQAPFIGGTGTHVSATPNEPVILITPATLGLGLPGMTLQVTSGRDTTGTPLTQLYTAPATIVEAVNQSSVVWIGYPPSVSMTPTTSVIDVNAGAGRMSFVPNAPTTAAHYSRFELELIPPTSTVNWGINVCTSNYTLTLADDTLEPAITTVTIGTGTSPFTPMVTPPAGYMQGWTSTGTAGNLLTTQTITITVNGTTILNTGKFYLKLVLAPVTVPPMSPLTVMDFTLADQWVLNNTSIRVPYMLIDARTALNSGYVSFIELVNRSGDDVCVDLDANISDAAAAPLPTETPGVFALSTNGPNLTCAFTLAAHAVTIVQPTDIVGYFPGSLTNTKLYRVGLTLYVAAPQNSVDATAFQIAPDGNRTNVPVLYNLNTTSINIGGTPILNGIGRQWLQ
jgi:hypothetical protein